MLNELKVYDFDDISPLFEDFKDDYFYSFRSCCEDLCKNRGKQIIEIDLSKGLQTERYCELVMIDYHDEIVNILKQNIPSSKFLVWFDNT